MLPGQGSDCEPRSSPCGHCGPGCAQASCVSLCPVVSFRAVVTLILGGYFCGRAVLMVEWGGARGLLCRCPLPGWCWGPDRPGSPSRALATLLSLLEGGHERMVSRLCLLILLWGKDGGAVVAPSVGGVVVCPAGHHFLRTSQSSSGATEAASQERILVQPGLFLPQAILCFAPLLTRGSGGQTEGLGVSIPL